MSKRRLQTKLAILFTLLFTQLGVELAALFSPFWLEGKMTVREMVKFQNDVDSKSWKTLTQAANISKKESHSIMKSISLLHIPEHPNDTYVDVAIGIFETIINGKTVNERREGLKSVVGFAMLSLLATVLAVFHCMAYSYELLIDNPKLLGVEGSCHKCFCDACMKGMKWANGALREIAAKNYAAGASVGTACVVFGFSAEESGNGTQYGQGFYLLAGCVIISFITNLLISHFESLTKEEGKCRRTSSQTEQANEETPEGVRRPSGNSARSNNSHQGTPVVNGNEPEQVITEETRFLDGTCVAYRKNGDSNVNNRPSEPTTPDLK